MSVPDRLKRIDWPVGVTVALILLVCLPPAPANGGVVPLCLLCGGQGVADLTLNALLYLPLGLALRYSGISLLRVVMAGFLLSLSVELIQLAIPGRFTSVGDLAANTLGGACGGLLAFDRATWLRPRERIAQGLSWGSACLASTLVVVSCALLGPVLPAGQIFVGWTPDLGHHAQYPGEVVEAAIGSVPLSSPRPISPDALQLLESGESVKVRFTFYPVGSTLAPVLQITAGRYGEALMIGLRADDVVIRRRLRAAELRMATPEVVFRGPWDIAPGDTMGLEFQIARDGRYLLTANTRDQSVSYTEGIGSQRGWSVWHYRPGLAEWFNTIIDLAWIFGLVAPAAFWSRSWPSVALTGALPLATTAAIPWFTAALMPQPAYFLWAGVVLIIGGVTGHKLRREDDLL